MLQNGALKLLLLASLSRSLSAAVLVNSFLIVYETLAVCYSSYCYHACVL